ncbi:MAG: ABC transporter ATP-binding protein [Pseudorhodoplanes sp.]
MTGAGVQDDTSDLLAIRDLKVAGMIAGEMRPLVKGVDLTVKRGEVLGLIGESGAGKSTIGLAAMGYSRPGCRIVGGQVLFRGTDLLRLTEQEKKDVWGVRVAYVAQSATAAFNPMRRIIDQCIEVPVQHGLMDQASARRELVGIFSHLRLPEPTQIGARYPHQLSGGQLQRAMTAMATCAHPDLVIFDEPTTALDVTTQIEVLAAIKRLVREVQVAAIYISHDLAIVAQMADRIVVLRHGRVVEEASTQEMMTNPREDYTKSLWAVRSLFKEEDLAAPLLLQLDNVSAQYGHHKVLHDISLTVPKGRTVAIVGESGSGKSTLARVVVGLLPPTQGRIRLAGSDLPPALKDRSRSLLRRIQIIHQASDAALNPRRRVGDILSRALGHKKGLPRSQRRQRVRELLRMVELDDAVATAFPRQLSGGQKQRVCIARALAAEPELIICDEVTSALDQLVAGEILKLLIDLQRRALCSYLVITHDLSIVRAIADQVVVLQNGRIVESGPKSQVLDAPQHDYTKLLLASVPRMAVGWLDKVLSDRAGIAAARDRTAEV